MKCCYKNNKKATKLSLSPWNSKPLTLIGAKVSKISWFIFRSGKDSVLTH